MKRFLLVFGLLLLVLLAILSVNTARFTSKQVAVAPVPPAEIDAEAAAQRLAAALRFPTRSVSDSTAWEAAPFDSLHAYLRATYPRVHAALRQEQIGGHALLYTWPGTRPALPPLVIMAHQDVVPVDPVTEPAWDHPPFAGRIAEGYVWGRGAMDDKSGVLGSLEAVEMLLAGGYAPERTVLLAYGHDEEVGGTRGAQRIARHLAAQQITPWLVVDEGGTVMIDHPLPVDAPVALIGIAEKGYLSLALSAHAEGGHSSMPPRETAVGILSTAIHQLQNAPFPARLAGATGTLFDYVGPEMPLLMRMLFANRWLFEPLLVGQLAANPSADATLRTTIAPTMLEGSPKDNVLPTQARAVVNFRILPGETAESVTERVRQIIDDPRIAIEPEGDYRNPSPVSPTDGAAFATLERTIREVFPGTLVAPYLVVGGTDAKHFSPLTPHVYRFLPLRIHDGDLPRVHGTNERILIDDYADAIRFYRQLILNATQETP